MAKYKILVIAHLLKNNQVGKFNQIVDESQLTTNPNELVHAGFIELVDEIVDTRFIASDIETKHDEVEKHKSEEKKSKPKK